MIDENVDAFIVVEMRVVPSRLWSAHVLGSGRTDSGEKWVKRGSTCRESWWRMRMSGLSL